MPRPAPMVRHGTRSALRARCGVPVPRAAGSCCRARPCPRGRRAPRGASHPRWSRRQRDPAGRVVGRRGVPERAARSTGWACPGRAIPGWGLRVPERCCPGAPRRQPLVPIQADRLRRSTRVPVRGGCSPECPAWARRVPAGAPARWLGRPGAVASPGAAASRRWGTAAGPTLAPRAGYWGLAAPAGRAMVGYPVPGPTRPTWLPGPVPVGGRCPTRRSAVPRPTRRVRPGWVVGVAEVPSPDPAGPGRTRRPASLADHRTVSVRPRPATPLPAAGRGGACLRTSCVRLLHHLSAADAGAWHRSRRRRTRTSRPPSAPYPVLLKGGFGRTGSLLRVAGQ